jgi:DNA-binding beta-propeller fold protein YncE
MRARLGRCAAAAAALAGASAGVAATPAWAVDPSAFTQLSGADGCLMQIGHDAEHGCLRVGGLALARSVALSPDDRYLYVASGGSLAVGSNGVVTLRRDPSSGALTWLGCVTANGGDGRVGSEGACARGDALLGAADIAISPDGGTAYVAAAGAGGLAWLSRDAASGMLTPAGCLKDFPRGDRCGHAPHLSGATSVAVSPDGLDVYVASPVTASVHTLHRAAGSPAPVPVQCLAETGLDGACEPAAGLQLVRDVTVSPDGRAVYAAGGSGAVTAFSRDPATGRLTERDCLLANAPEPGPCEHATGIAGAAGVAVSPDGRDVYVAAARSEAVASFRVEPDGGLRQTGCLQRRPSGPHRDGPCRPATALWNPREIVVSADGRTVFAGGLDTITSYRRDPDTGRLTQLGCAEEDQSSELCLEVRATLGVNALAATADGRNVYVTADAESAVAVLGAAVTILSGALRADRAGRVRVRLHCPAARVRPCAGAVRIGRGPARAYRLHRGSRTVVRVRMARRALRRLERRGRARLGVRASDRTRTLRDTRRRVVVRAARHR